MTFPTDDMHTAKQAVQELLDRLSSGEPLMRSADYNALAATVVEQTKARQEPDLQYWATSLAADVAHLTD